MTKIAGSRSASGSGSISQRHGSADPDLHQTPFKIPSETTKQLILCETTKQLILCPGMDVEETNTYFPLKEFITFNAPLKADALINKLKEFNNQVAQLLSSQGVHHLQCSS
jgi:hypothetical protein